MDLCIVPFIQCLVREEHLNVVIRRCLNDFYPWKSSTLVPDRVLGQAGSWITWKVWSHIRCIKTIDFFIKLIPWGVGWERILLSAVYRWWRVQWSNSLLWKLRFFSCPLTPAFTICINWSTHSIPYLKKVLILYSFLSSEWFLEILKVWRRYPLHLLWRHIRLVDVWPRLSFIGIYVREIILIHDLFET